MVEFNRSIAIVVGIDHYQHGIPPLKTAVADAQTISQVLRIDHGYQSGLLTDGQATLTVLRSLLTEKLPAYIQPDDRLLFYFAGHGLAFNGDEGPEGYLIPQDATLGKSDTYLPMTEVHDALTALHCRHFLGIFDCCFAGAFRWSATRDLSPVPEVIHRERYERFLTDPAWQVITSSADDQKALDVLALTDHRGQVGQHSPFAQALIQALQANSVADASPPTKNGQPAGDGVITATELYQYLRDAIEPETIEKARRQTPGLWPLNKHGKGEFIFLVPGRQPNLPAAPPLNADSNPYRGLEAFEEIHQNLFFGRQQLIKDLQTFVETHPHTVVLGASGTGKSSLVKAGLVPALKRTLDIGGQPLWQVLAVLRPGAIPLKALVQALQASSLGLTVTSDTPEALALAFHTSLEQWRQANSQAKLLLIIDQAEELFSLCREPDQRQQFLQLLAQGQEQRSDWFHVVFTLRSDFEPQFRGMAVENLWSCDRFLIRPMNREELRAAIEAPASAKVIYFDPPDLVDRLIDEVNEMPGALPLLSFTLRELFLKYLRTASARTSRAITMDDYEALGGIKQALVNRADEEYQLLVNQDPAFADTIRRVMLRLVATGGTGNTRRQVLLSELDYPESEGDRVNQVIARLKEARLLVSDTNADGDPYVEPAHDALVEGWPRLLQWLEPGSKQESLGRRSQKRWFPWLTEWGVIGRETSLNEREKLLLQRRLTPAAIDWQREQKPKFLWHADARLPLLKQIRRREPSWFNTTESKFIVRSLSRKRFNVALRWVIMAGLLSSSVVASLYFRGLNLQLVSTSQNLQTASDEAKKNAQRAQAEAQRAETQTLEAQKRSVQNFTNDSRSLFRSQQQLDALVKALQAARLIQSSPDLKNDAEAVAQTQFALYQAFYGAQETHRLPSQRSALSPTGNFIATLNGDLIQVWSNSEEKYVLSEKHGFEMDEDYSGWEFEISFNPNETAILVSRLYYDESEQNKLASKTWQFGQSSFEVDDLNPSITKFSPHDDFAFTQNGLIRLSDLKEFQIPVENLFFSPDAQNISWQEGSKISIVKLENLGQVESPIQTFSIQKDDDLLDTNSINDYSASLVGFFANDSSSFLITSNYASGSSTKLVYRAWDLNGNLLAQTGEEEISNSCDSDSGRGEVPIASPGGKFLIFKCSDGSIVLEEVLLEENSYGNSQDEEPKVIVLGQRRRINLFSLANVYFGSSEVSISRDDLTWLISNSEGSLSLSKLWNLNKQDVQRTKIFKIDDADLIDFDIDPGGGQVLSATTSGEISTWNLATSDNTKLMSLSIGDEIREKLEQAEYGYAPPLIIAKYSPQGKYIAVAFENKVQLIDANGTLLRSMQHSSQITSLDFHPTEDIFASASTDGNLKIWRLDGSVFQDLDIGKIITEVQFNLKGDAVALAYANEPLDETYENELVGSIRVISFQGEQIAEFSAYKTPFVTRMDFLEDNNTLMFSGQNKFSAGGTGIKIVDIRDGTLKKSINVKGSSEARHLSFDPFQKLLITDVQVVTDENISALNIWHVNGTILADQGHMNAQISQEVYPASFYPVVRSAKFSLTGEEFAAKITEFSDSGNKDYIALWSFGLDELTEKSCQLLSNYLSTPLATEEEKQLCHGDFTATRTKADPLPLVDPSTSIPTSSSEPVNGVWLPDWLPSYDQLGQVWVRQPKSENQQIDPIPVTYAQLLGSQMDLSGLELDAKEQSVFFRLQTQVSAWDMDGARSSLSLLQISDNVCVSAFANQLTDALDQQDGEGFRQITPIKRELNAQQGCTLPLYPYPFSP